MNCDKSGHLASNNGAVAFIEEILDARMLWALGGVVVLGDPGPGEPAWVAAAPQLVRPGQVSKTEALVAAARASVVIVGQGSFFHPEAWEAAAVAGCFVWSGQWAELDAQAGERAVGQLLKHGQERRMRMSYRKTLKDLGVAQGLGREAKDLAAKRHATL